MTIFGSARVPKDHWVYQAVRDLAAELTRLDCDIVTGGGPGLMQAANEGRRLADPEGKRKSMGIRVDLPFEQEVNAFVTEAFEHGTFFTRLHHFVLVSDAFVVVPGGIGTRAGDDDDLAAAAGAQAARHAADPRRQDVRRAGRVVQDVHAPADCPLASPQDMTIPVCVEDGPAILRLIRETPRRVEERGIHESPTC